MRVLAKTFGWLVVSGLIIFISNLSAGVPCVPALIAAAVAKLGTTITYLLYEIGFERFAPAKIATATETNEPATVASSPSIEEVFADFYDYDDAVVV